MSNPNQIPTYKGRWPWSAASELLAAPLDFHKDKIEQFGDTYHLKFPLGKVLITSNPEFIKHVFQGNHKNYEKDPSYDQLAFLLGKGLVTSRGDLWKKQRKIAQPTFYKKSLQKLYLDMVDVTKKYLEELDGKRGQEIDISREMMAVTGKIAMKSLFSQDMEGDLKDIYECISVAQEYVSQRAINPLSIPLGYFNGAHRRFKKQKAVMDNLILGLIADRKKSPSEKHDFLQMLLDARYEDNGEPMPLDLLRDELVTIFSAGHETSSNGLAWTIYQLAQNPEIVEKIRAEADEVFGDGVPSFEDLRKLDYTRMVIEEGMRLFPPVWGVGRIAKEDDEFEGAKIKKGQIIFLLIYYLHRRPDLWENPEKFDPLRFSNDKVKARPKFNYLPFAAGPRMCIGNHFAMMEMQLLLPVLVKNFDFELIENQNVVKDPKVTLRAKYGIKMKIR